MRTGADGAHGLGVAGGGACGVALGGAVADGPQVRDHGAPELLKETQVDGEAVGRRGQYLGGPETKAALLVMEATA